MSSTRHKQIKKLAGTRQQLCFKHLQLGWLLACCWVRLVQHVMKAKPQADLNANTIEYQKTTCSPIAFNEELEELDCSLPLCLIWMPGQSSLCPEFQCLDWQDLLQYRQEHEAQRHVFSSCWPQQAQIRFIARRSLVWTYFQSASNSVKISSASLLAKS